MSSYFGALIRSSGLRVGARSAAATAEVPPVGDIVEIDDVRDVSQPPTAAASLRDEPHVPVARSIVSPERAPVARDRQMPSRETARLAPRDESPESLTVDVQESRSAHDADQESRVRIEHLDPVRLAMQWVAADPEAQPVSRATASPEPREIAPAAVPPPAALPPFREPIIEVDEQVMSVSHEEPRARRGTGDSGVRALPPPPSARREPADPDRRQRVTRSPAPIEESVEISIGAINVHVEAPATQIAAQAPAPRPQPASPARASERSGLERRYLRSF